MKNVLISLLLFITMTGMPQENKETKKTIPVSVSIFNNSPQMPFGGTFGITSTPIHPGISIGTSHAWNKNPVNRIYQTFNLGYFFHRFSEHGIMLYSEFAYMRHFSSGLSAGVSLGLGLEQSIADFPVYRMIDNEYQRTSRWGRPQFMGSIGMEVDYQAACMPFPLFFKYQFWMHGPFVANYVPVLPATAVHLGVKLHFTK